MLITLKSQLKSYGQKKASLKRGFVHNGAQGRTRTVTVLPPGDFKSPASTNFATWASDDWFISVF